MGILFTIAIPAYKACFLHDAIQSVLNQTFAQFELIIINDASPESIKDVVTIFNDTRIFYFENEVNQGAEHLVNNWNLCLEKAKGDYFVLLGDDDLLHKDFLTSCISILGHHTDVPILHCRTRIINELGEEIHLTPELSKHETELDLIYQRIVKKRSQYISDFIFNTAELKAQGGFYYLPLAQMSDDITAYILSRSNGVLNINLPVFNYRQHASTISSIGNAELTLKAIQLGEYWLKQELASMNIPANSKELIQFKLIKQHSLFYFRELRVSVLVRSFLSNKFQSLSSWKMLLKNNLIKRIDILWAIFSIIKVSLILKIRSKK